MYRRIPACLAPLGLLCLVAASEPPATGASSSGASASAASGDVVARRGDLTLTVADVRAMLDHADPATRARAEASPSALAAFVHDKLVDRSLLAEAEAKGWDKKPDIVERIKEAKDAVILQTYAASLVPPDPNFPPDSAVTQTYEVNKARFMVPRQYHLTQIVILVPPDAKPDVAEAARRKAADLRAQALRPKADFAALAKKNSQDVATAEKGGDAGWVREDTLLPQVRAAVANLNENGTTEVLRLPDGFHVVRVLGIKPAAPAPLDDVRPQIIQALRQARVQQGIRTYIDGMLKAEPIQLNEIDLAQKVKVRP
ncbi:MAG TPA: peptidylprolyl isomerase [Rhodopila sp.]|uniref:peptidylprolyl isomerase n=1 Tax=Rhodopila sp. TaxID=2480087 RepID=UPI002C8E9204|nr:peptidylprolyl isomerase [Rhodopila sp.]HVY16514.1 peptidylprolyl isomerase [Rhodopila sp.]